jgi:hypothetical protein
VFLFAIRIVVVMFRRWFGVRTFVPQRNIVSGCLFRI